SLGPFLGCKHAVKAMSRGGGAIVNVSSTAAVAGVADIPIYSASQGSGDALTRAVAAYCRRAQKRGRCNTVIPGSTRSKMTRDFYLNKGVDLDAGPLEALGLNMVDPDKIAQVIVFLASDEAAHVNGIEIIVDGGNTQLRA